MGPHLVKATKADHIHTLPKICVCVCWFRQCPYCLDFIWVPRHLWDAELRSRVLIWRTGRIIPPCSAWMYGKSERTQLVWDWSCENCCDKTLNITDWNVSISKWTPCRSLGCLLPLPETTTGEFALQWRVYIFLICLSKDDSCPLSEKLD